MRQTWFAVLGGFIGGVVVARVTALGLAPEVISAFAQLLWPLVVVIVSFWFREDLRNVLARLRKGKFPGGEFELDEGKEKPPPPEQHDRARSAMEFKILKTLWTKQVNRFPKYDGVWTFRLNSVAPEFLDFREAVNKLIGEGLIDETPEGQVFLTRRGFEYCKAHHSQFPDDQWWPEEKLNAEQLAKALEG